MPDLCRGHAIATRRSTSVEPIAGHGRIADGLDEGDGTRSSVALRFRVLPAVTMSPEFRAVSGWTKLALKFPTRRDEEHERQSVHGRADHLFAAPS